MSGVSRAVFKDFCFGFLNYVIMKYLSSGNIDKSSGTRTADSRCDALLSTDALNVRYDDGSLRNRCLSWPLRNDNWCRSWCRRRSGSREKEAHLRVLVSIREQRDGREVFQGWRRGCCGCSHWHWVAEDAQLTSVTV